MLRCLFLLMTSVTVSPEVIHSLDGYHYNSHVSHLLRCELSVWYQQLICHYYALRDNYSITLSLSTYEISKGSQKSVI
jgi:hypothetical protein